MCEHIEQAFAGAVGGGPGAASIRRLEWATFEFSGDDSHDHGVGD